MSASRWRLAGSLALVALGVPVAACAAQTASPHDERPFSGPLVMRNDSPLYQPLGSAALPARAAVAAPGHWSAELGYLDSNNIVDQNNSAVTDRVIVDGEMQRVELTLRYGLRDRWELGATVPYLAFVGGYMDDFIDSFEGAFGLTTPRARRIRDAGQVRYLFRINGQNLIDRDAAFQGLGDLPLFVTYRWRNEPGGLLPRVALRGVLKCPTATDPLLGNGRVDAGLGVTAEQPLGRRVRLLGALDVTSAHLPLALKTVDIDPVVVSGWLGFEQFLTDRASWKAQISLATNPYPKFDRDMTTLNTPPMGIGLGWVYRLFPKTAVKLAVIENLDQAWPDFSWTASVQADL